MTAAIAKRLHKLEQARKPNDAPGLHFTSASETGAAYVTVAGFGDEGHERLFPTLPSETHEQTLRRACELARRGEGLPFVTSYTA